MADAKDGAPNGAPSPQTDITAHAASSPDEQQSAHAESPVLSEDEKKKTAIPALVARSVAELAALPEEERQDAVDAITAVVSYTSQTRFFSGPLPSPEAFSQYNEVLPNAADRILGMAEKEQDIRYEAQKGAIANDRRRIHAAFIVAWSVVIVAGFAAWLGQVSIAIPLGLAGLLGIIVREIFGRNSGSKRRMPSDPDQGHQD